MAQCQYISSAGAPRDSTKQSSSAAMSLCVSDPGVACGIISTSLNDVKSLPKLLDSRNSGISRRLGKRQCLRIISSASRHQQSRREFFLAGTSAIGASTVTSLNRQAGAAPVELNNLGSCGEASLPAGARPVDCCPPDSATSPVDFVYDTSLPTRQRQAAHLVNSAYISKYNRAYQLMRSLPASDPRSFQSQANIHCAYCNDAFTQSGSTSLLQIHNSWLFLPWHRWYLFFHERILGSLINDDTFAIPYWNWDDNQAAVSPAGNTMPTIYVNNAALNDRLRDSLHLPPRLVDLNYAGQDESVTAAAQRAENNGVMYQQIVSGARTASLFHGGVYQAGDAETPGGGTLENAPHGPVHGWTGSRSQPNREDMGTFYSAARDPIFYAHHANIDRLWAVWKRIPGGRRTDFTDPDWLDAKFLFYDEKSRLVRVSVRDGVNPQQLGYSYSARPDAWITARPTTVAGSSVAAARSISTPPGAAMAADLNTGSIEVIEEKSRRLEQSFTCRVKRDPGRRSGDDLEEILVVEGVEIDCNQASKFDVYINLPGAGDKTSCNVVEFVGTFVNVPHFHKGADMKNMIRKAKLRLGISETIEQLGLSDADEIVVTLVPRGLGNKFEPVVFRNIRIEYE